MALVGEKMASDATLDKVQCICLGRRPIETCTKGLATKGPSCCLVIAKSGVNFRQELPPFLLGDTSLKYPGSAFPIKLSLMDLVGFGVPHNAECLILILGEFVPVKVGQEGFGPWGNDCHYEMGRRCYFGG